MSCLASLSLVLLATPVPRAVLPVQEGALQGGADDAARILPADALVVIRLESTQAWNGLVRAFAPLGGPTLATYDLQATLDGMADAGSDPAALPRLDRERPLFLAVSFEPTGNPVLTLAVPVTNGQPFRLQPALGPTSSRVVGSYAAVSNRTSPPDDSAPSALLAELRPGLVSVRVDLARLIATFRPVIDMGLAQAEASLAHMPHDESGFDAQPLMETYLEAARALVDSARSFDLTLARGGDGLSLRADYTGGEEHAATPTLADLEPMLGLLDPRCPIQVASNGRWIDFLRTFEDFTAAALEVYPEPLRTDMKRLLGQQDALEALLAPGLASSFDLGPGGLRGSTFVRATKPRELVAAFEELLRSLDHEGGLLRLGPAETLAVSGIEARSFSAEIRYDVLADAFARSNPAAGADAKQALVRLRGALEAVYGKELRFALAQRGETVAVCLGADDSELVTQLVRLGKPATPLPSLAAMLPELEPGATGFVYHFDLGKFASRMAAVQESIAPTATAFPHPDIDLPMDFWCARHGATWSGGMGLSLGQLQVFLQRMGALPGGG